MKTGELQAVASLSRSLAKLDYFSQPGFSVPPPSTTFHPKGRRKTQRKREKERERIEEVKQGKELLLPARFPRPGSASRRLKYSFATTSFSRNLHPLPSPFHSLLASSTLRFVSFRFVSLCTFSPVRRRFLVANKVTRRRNARRVAVRNDASRRESVESAKAKSSLSF